EGVLLSLLALPLAAYIAYEVPRIAKAMVPMLPYYNMRPNLVVFGYLMLLTTSAGCLAGLAPASESLRADVWNRARGRDGFILGARWRARDILIAGQVGMSLVLLWGAVLFVRAESAIRHHNPGLDTEHTVVVPLNGGAATTAVLLERVRAIPGVRSAATAEASP